MKIMYVCIVVRHMIIWWGFKMNEELKQVWERFIKSKVYVDNEWEIWAGVFE
jgi:hypothetical protein